MTNATAPMTAQAVAKYLEDMLECIDACHAPEVKAAIALLRQAEAAQTAPVVAGWLMRYADDNKHEIIVQKPCVGGYVARDDDSLNIASFVLHQLAADLLAAAPAPNAQPAELAPQDVGEALATQWAEDDFPDQPAEQAAVEGERRAVLKAQIRFGQTLAERRAKELQAARRAVRELTDDEIMDLVRDKCIDFRWPSTAIEIARLVLSKATGEGK